MVQLNYIYIGELFWIVLSSARDTAKLNLNNSELSEEDRWKEKSVSPQTKRFKKKDYEDKLLMSMDKTWKTISYLKNKFSNTQMDSVDTFEPESSIKKGVIKTRSLVWLIKYLTKWNTYPKIKNRNQLHLRRKIGRK